MDRTSWKPKVFKATENVDYKAEEEGTSDGAKKGWLTRQRGGSAEEPKKDFTPIDWAGQVGATKSEADQDKASDLMDKYYELVNEPMEDLPSDGSAMEERRSIHAKGVADFKSYLESSGSATVNQDVTDILEDENYHSLNKMLTKEEPETQSSRDKEFYDQSTQNTLDTLNQSKVNGFPFFSYVGQPKQVISDGKGGIILYGMKRNPNSIRRVDVKYDEGRDTYTVSFMSNRNKPKGEYNDVYFDQLSGLIAGNKGLGVESKANENIDTVDDYFDYVNEEPDERKCEFCGAKITSLFSKKYMIDHVNSVHDAGLNPTDGQKLNKTFPSWGESYASEAQIPCKECGGKGVTNWLGEDEMRCSVCEGTGVIDSEWEDNMDNEEHVYDAPIYIGTNKSWNESYATEDDYKYDWDQLTSLAQKALTDIGYDKESWDSEPEDIRKEMEKVAYSEENWKDVANKIYKEELNKGKKIGGEAMYGYGSATGRMSPVEAWNQGADVYGDMGYDQSLRNPVFDEFRGLQWNELPTDIQEAWKSELGYMTKGEGLADNIEKQLNRFGVNLDRDPEQIEESKANEIIFGTQHKLMDIPNNGWDFSVIGVGGGGDGKFEVGIFKQGDFGTNQVKPHLSWIEVEDLKRTFESDPVMAFKRIGGEWEESWQDGLESKANEEIIPDWNYHADDNDSDEEPYDDSDDMYELMRDQKDDEEEKTKNESKASEYGFDNFDSYNYNSEWEDYTDEQKMNMLESAGAFASLYDTLGQDVNPDYYDLHPHIGIWELVRNDNFTSLEYKLPQNIIDDIKRQMDGGKNRMAEGFNQGLYGYVDAKCKTCGVEFDSISDMDDHYAMHSDHVSNLDDLDSDIPNSD